MIELTNIEVKCGILHTTHNVSHSTPGRDGKCLEQNLKMEIKSPSVYKDCHRRVKAELLLTECYGETPQEVVDKMINWCERMAEALKEERPTLDIIV